MCTRGHQAPDDASHAGSDGCAGLCLACRAAPQGRGRGGSRSGGQVQRGPRCSAWRWTRQNSTGLPRSVPGSPSFLRHLTVRDTAISSFGCAASMLPLRFAQARDVAAFEQLKSHAFIHRNGACYFGPGSAHDETSRLPVLHRLHSSRGLWAHRRIPTQWRVHPDLRARVQQRLA